MRIWDRVLEAVKSPEQREAEAAARDLLDAAKNLEILLDRSDAARDEERGSSGLDATPETGIRWAPEMVHRPPGQPIGFLHPRR